MDVYLKKIELHGFKSFPEKITLQFHKGVTAIIGPNGCGKSNLVDAILWVLGEQRIKHLRGEDNQDLIFNGSSTKKPLGMTEVGMFINNKDQDTFIARRFFRSGEGKYILNEKFCRNKDIQDALFELGIGEKAYFIFEQGSVEKMVSLKAHERRILIEEAAGIAQYLEKKKETASKLIISQQNLDNLEIIIAEKGKRLKELKNQAQYVQRYRTAKNQRSEGLKALLKKKYLHFREEFDAIRQKLETEITHESSFAKEISENEEKLLHLEQERWEEERHLKGDQQQLFGINGTILNSQKEQEKSQQRIGFIRQRSIELKQSKESGSTDVFTLEEREHAFTLEGDQHQEQLEVHEEQMRTWQERALALQEKYATVLARGQELKKSSFQVENEAAAAANQALNLEKSLQRLQNEIAGKRHLLLELESHSRSDEVDRLESQCSDQDRLFQEGETRLKEKEKAFLEFRGDLQSREEQIRKLRLEIQYLRGQKLQYEKIRGIVKAPPSMEEQPEHLGTLQELIQADKTLHPILENFYYDEMDAPILRHAEDALSSGVAKAILKRDSSDTFPEQIRQEAGFKGFVRDLFHLEKPEYRSYFKEGVLTSDLRQGLAIFAKYGTAVVTEKGEVITHDGMFVRHRQKGILEVQSAIKEAEGRLTSLQRELEASEKELAGRQTGGEDILAEVTQCREAFEAARKQSIALHSQVDMLRKSKQLTQDRIRTNRSETENLSAEEEKIRLTLADAAGNKESIEKRRLELQGFKESLSQEIERFRLEMAEVEKSLVIAQHGLALVQEKLQSSQQFTKDLSSQKQKLVRQIASADKEVAAIQEEQVRLLRNVDDLQKEEREQNKKKEAMEGQIRKEEEHLVLLDQQIKKHQAVLTAARNARDEVRQRKQEAEIVITGLKKDLFQLEEISAQELSVEMKDIEAQQSLMQEPLEALEKLVEEYSQRLNKMRDNERLNFSAEAEAEIVDKDYQFLLSQKEDVLKSIQDMHAAIEKIDTESKESFMRAFTAIREKFVTNFKILFEGGEADLALTNEENLLESGLEIQAQPPGKRLQNIRLLSGGEKTLTSLAFLFSLFQYKPSPFCVFDEVDASLDEANIQRFLNFLSQLKEKTQFVIITHNFKTMEKADFIYGISMDEPGISKIYSMKMN